MEAETKPSGLIGEGDNPFVGALENAYSVPYRGDAADVGSLLRNLIADSVTRWTSGKDASDAEKLEADSEDIDEVVSVLLGKDPDFAPVPVWNAPGHIDLWIKKQVPSIADESPEDVVESAVRLFLLECWTVIDDWNQPGSNEADCQNAITLVIDQWVSVFLGIDAAALNEMESELKSAEDLGNEIGAALTEGSVRKSLADVWDEEDERKHPRGEGGRWAGKGGGSSGGKGPKKNPKYDDGDAGESYSPPDDDEWLASPKKPSYQSSFGFGSKHGGGYVPKGKTAEEREADDLPDDPTIKELAKKYPKLGELFSGTSGTEAGSVEQHTKVMKNRFRQQMPEAELAGLDERWGGNLKKVLDVALSLHDIGKPLAVKAGDKSRQHEFSSPVILETMKAEGFTDREINLTEALVGHDVLGEAVKALNERPVAGKKFEPHDVDVASEIVAAAKLADMSPQDFAKLQLAFYHADAGSYGYVRNSFMKQDESGRLSLKSKVAIQDAIDIAEGKPIPPPRVSFSNKTTADQFIAARNATSRPGFLSPLVPEDLKSHSLFVSNDGKVGVAVSKDGDIQNVFNNGGPKGGGVDAVLQAIRNGGKTLDCFDGYLPGLYAQLGFVETGRMKFNREYAPEGWDFEKYGEPDVVFMGLPKGGLSREQELEFRRRAKGDKSAWIAPAKSDAYYDDWDKAKSDSRGAVGSGDGKEDEGRGSHASAGGAGAGASSGVRRPVDSKPSPSQKKTPVVRDYTDETMKGVWGSDDPYVYHASPLSIDVVKFQEGLKPSKSGHGGAGVYFATDPEATYWHADKGKSRLFRVNKAALVNKFGKFPEDFDGVEHDELDGEVIVGGSRRIPADMLEVQVDGKWMSVRDAAKAGKAAKKKSLGLERYSLAALMKTFDESKVVRNRGRFAPKGSARVAGEKKPSGGAERSGESPPSNPAGDQPRSDGVASSGSTSIKSDAAVGKAHPVSIGEDEVSNWLADSANKEITYHVTSQESSNAIETNGVDVSRSSAGGLIFGQGFYTSTSLEDAKSQANTPGAGVVRVAIKMKNPLDLTKDPSKWGILSEIQTSGFNAESQEKIRKHLLDAGYDGIILPGSGGARVVVAITNDSVRVVGGKESQVPAGSDAAPSPSGPTAGDAKPKAAAFGELVRASFPKLPKGADVIAQFGETLPLDEAEQVFVAAGLDELTAADLVADLRERGDKDSVSSKTVAVIARSQLYKADEAGRRSAVVDAVGGDRVAMFEVPDERQTKFIVHPSTRSPGKWQLSRMDKNGPIGHSEFDSQDEALASAVAAHPKGHMFNDGDSDAVLTTSVASNGVTRSHGGAKKKSLSSVLDDVSRFVGFDVELDRYRLRFKSVSSIDPRKGATCPHCGSTETFGARTVERDKNGNFVRFANTECRKCGNGFGVDIEEARLKTFDESKHRRGQPGNAGQFAPKGSAGAGAKKPKETKPKAAKAAPAASSSTPLSSEALTAAIGTVKLRERRHVTVEYADGSVFAGAPMSKSPDNSLIMFGGKWKSGPKAGESMVLAVKARDKDIVSLGYKTDAKPKKEKTAAPAKAAEVEAAKPAAPATVPASQETKQAADPSSSSEPVPPQEPTAKNSPPLLTVSVPKDTMQELLSHSDDLTPEERSVVSEYTLSDYSVINGDLLGKHPKQVPAGSVVRPGYEKSVEVLDRVTSKKLSKPITVFSGLNPEAWGDVDKLLQTGDVVKRKGYLSSSIDPSVAGTFTWSDNPLVAEVTTDRGLYVDPISKNAGEKEVLLPRNASYKVTGVEDRMVEVQSNGKKYHKKVRVVKMTAHYGDS